MLVKTTRTGGRVMDIRKIYQAEYNKYRWNASHDKNLDKRVKVLLNEDKVYADLCAEDVIYDAQARALDAVLAVIDSLHSGFVVGV